MSRGVSFEAVTLECLPQLLLKCTLKEWLDKCKNGNYCTWVFRLLVTEDQITLSPWSPALICVLASVSLPLSVPSINTAQNVKKKSQTKTVPGHTNKPLGTKMMHVSLLSMCVSSLNTSVSWGKIDGFQLKLYTGETLPVYVELLECWCPHVWPQ